MQESETCIFKKRWNTNKELPELFKKKIYEKKAVTRYARI